MCHVIRPRYVCLSLLPIPASSGQHMQRPGGRLRDAPQHGWRVENILMQSHDYNRVEEGTLLSFAPLPPVPRPRPPSPSKSKHVQHSVADTCVFGGDDDPFNPHHRLATKYVICNCRYNTPDPDYSYIIPQRG